MAWTPPPSPTAFNTRPEDVLFLDIETVPSFASIDEATNYSKDLNKLFIKKYEKWIVEKKEQFIKVALPGEDYIDKTIRACWMENAALNCEFNKIACVSMGVFTTGDNGERTLRIKSFFGYNEAMILNEIKPKLGAAKFVCAHNGKKFDFPLLARKYVQHGIIIPSILNVTGLKPWEVNHFDTMEMFSFNDNRNFTSLDALCYIVDVESPKKEMDGSKVAEVYYSASKAENSDLPWEDITLKPIADYCGGDVVALANCYLRIINQPVVKPENIVIV